MLKVSPLESEKERKMLNRGSRFEENRALLVHVKVYLSKFFRYQGLGLSSTADNSSW